MNEQQRQAYLDQINYVQEGTAADKMWDKLTDFYDQTPWWEYADHQVSTGRYPKYW